MLTHKGTSYIETENLILRKFTIDDAEEMFNNWASDEEVTKYLTWLPHKEIAVSKAILTEWTAAYENLWYYQWAIIHKEHGKPIGGISVVEINEEVEQCEIGYCMGRKYWGKGIMAEALKGVITYLIKESGFRRIQARHDIRNPASGRVMAKAGMKPEGIMRKHSKNNKGEYVDCQFYAILKEDLENNCE